MAQNYWKQGNLKNAAKIRAAFEELVDENRQPLLMEFENEERIYIFDGVRRLIYVAEYNSALSEAIMGSSLFEELPIKIDPKFEVGQYIRKGDLCIHIINVDVKGQRYDCKLVDSGNDWTIYFRSQETYERFEHQPRFKVGQVVVSKEDPEIRYIIREVGIPNEMGNLDYRVENISKGYTGTMRLINVDKMDSWGVPLEEFEKEAHVSGIPVSALGQMPEVMDFDEAVANALGLPSNLVKVALAEFKINFEGMKQRWLSDACTYLCDWNRALEAKFKHGPHLGFSLPDIKINVYDFSEHMKEVMKWK